RRQAQRGRAMAEIVNADRRQPGGEYQPPEVLRHPVRGQFRPVLLREDAARILPRTAPGQLLRLLAPQPPERHQVVQARGVERHQVVSHGVGRHRPDRRLDALLSRRSGRPLPSYACAYLRVIGLPRGEQGRVLLVDPREHFLDFRRERPVEAYLVKHLAEVRVVVRDVPRPPHPSPWKPRSRAGGSYVPRPSTSRSRPTTTPSAPC